MKIINEKNVNNLLKGCLLLMLTTFAFSLVVLSINYNFLNSLIYITISFLCFLILLAIALKVGLMHFFMISMASALGGGIIGLIWYLDINFLEILGCLIIFMIIFVVHSIVNQDEKFDDYIRKN